MNIKAYSNPGRSMKLIILLLSFSLMLLFKLSGQVHTVDNFCITTDEQKLISRINQFRKDHKQPEIAISASLCFVAKTHLADLQVNKPDTSICTTGSWSDKGSWKPCCYNPFVYKPECMWDKPKELASYNYRGYEMVYFEDRIVQVDSAFRLWTESAEVVDFILGKGDHSDKKWAAIGVGVGENYISVWFGQRPDPKNKPGICDIHDIPFRVGFTDHLVGTEDNQKTSRFYLVIGSFNSLTAAQESMKHYKEIGFKNANLLLKDNNIRVTLDVFDSLKEAMAARDKLGETYSDSWILKD